MKRDPHPAAFGDIPPPAGGGVGGGGITFHLSRFTPLASRLTLVALCALLAACGSAPRQPEREAKAERQGPGTVPGVVLKKGGGYYLDDGPGDNPPADLDAIPDAVPREEPLRRANMRPYSALGKSYTPMTELAPYKERGIASWYGRRYHGQKTASGEVYDMYGMTAAHPTLPIPSYARVTNLKNNKSVVVRVNDRGPFHSGRLIDLSYTAAWKLEVLAGGSQWVEVESLLPGAAPPTQIASAPAAGPAPAAPAAPAAPLPAPAPAPTPAPAPEAEKPQPQAEPAPALAATPEASGVYLQLGAFSARDNAENFLARLRAELAGLAESLNILARDGLFRVRAGPYPSAAEARGAADRIAQALGIKPFVMPR